MNKFIYSLIAFVGILTISNCSPKTVKNTTTENKNIETVNVEIPFGSKSIEEQMDIVRSMETEENITDGGQIYQANCGKCHELFQPDSRNIGSWMKVMKRMSKEAKLSEQQYKLVSVYLNSKAKA
jgi:cytochrome c2